MHAGFSGYLSSDAYISYETLSAESAGRIILCGCLMHARRRFAEALELIRLGNLTKAQIEGLPEYRALVLLGKIYNAEGGLKACDPEERLRRRTREVRPLVEQFYSFISSLDMDDPMLSEKMKDAISYSFNHKETLCRFLGDGRIPCDNGYVENVIRLYAQGRRNWLFSNTPDGAMASTIVYSMIETARRNNAKCRNERMRDVVDHFGEEVETWVADEGHFRVRARVADSPTFYSWVFGFVGDIRIIEPEAAVKRYKQMLRSGLK